MRMRCGVAAALLALAVASCAGHIGEHVGTPTLAASTPGVQDPAAALYIRTVAADAADVQQAVQAAEGGLQSLALNSDGAAPGFTAQLVELVGSNAPTSSARTSPSGCRPPGVNRSPGGKPRCSSRPGTSPPRCRV